MSETMEVEEQNRKRYYFVYGSLREGCHNYRLLNKAKRVGDIWLLQGYDLYSLGSYPAIFPSERNGAEVTGEVYELTDLQTIQYIDRMELGAGYEKKTTIVYAGQKPLAVTVFVYLNQPHSEMVEHGDWKAHLEMENEMARA